MRWSFLNAIAVTAAELFVASQLAAQPLVVAGSPGYDSTLGTGFQNAYVYFAPAPV